MGRRLEVKEEAVKVEEEAVGIGNKAAGAEKEDTEIKEEVLGLRSLWKLMR